MANTDFRKPISNSAPKCLKLKFFFWRVLFKLNIYVLNDFDWIWWHTQNVGLTLTVYTHCNNLFLIFLFQHETCRTKETQILICISSTQTDTENSEFQYPQNKLLPCWYSRNSLAQKKFFRIFLFSSITNSSIIYSPEDGGSMLLRNIGTQLQVHTVSQTKIPPPTSLKTVCSCTSCDVYDQKSQWSTEIWMTVVAD
jgi:hypothetical protein